MAYVTTKRTFMLLFVVTLMLTLIPSLVGTSEASTRDRTSDEQRVEKRLFDNHNKARSNPGSYGYGNFDSQAKFRWAPDVADVARAWSDEMARTGTFKHNPNWQSQTCCWTTAGENIIWSTNYLWYGTREQLSDVLMQSWMDSTGHRNNIMNANFTQVGIGATLTSDNRVYVTTVFRRPTADAPTSYTTYQGTSTPASSCAGTSHALVGDWNGNGKDGIGWWCDGQTRLREDGGKVHEFRYGRAGDVPIVADWNGNGKDTVSIIRDGTWHVNNQLRGGDAERTFTYGRVTKGDVPIAGDWTRGGKDLPGIVRDREWHLRSTQSGGPATWSFIYGRLTRGDLPLWGDWNGDGKDTVGIVRDGTWHLRNQHAGGDSDIRYIYGRVLSGDTPVVGDWNGDGKDTPAIVRGNDWHLKHSHGGGPADRVLTFNKP